MSVAYPSFRDSDSILWVISANSVDEGGERRHRWYGVYPDAVPGRERWADSLIPSRPRRFGPLCPDGHRKYCSAPGKPCLHRHMPVLQHLLKSSHKINPFIYFAEHHIQSFAYNTNIVQIKAEYKRNTGEIQNYGGRSKPHSLKRNVVCFIKRQ